jgi:hypothetical protein
VLVGVAPGVVAELLELDDGSEDFETAESGVSLRVDSPCELGATLFGDWVAKARFWEMMGRTWEYRHLVHGFAVEALEELWSALMAYLKRSQSAIKDVLKQAWTAHIIEPESHCVL